MKKRAKKREWITFNNAIVFIIILLVIGVIRAILSAETGIVGAKVDLEKESIRVLSKITDEGLPVSLLSSNELVEEKVEYLKQMDYEEIKGMLGIKSDFCIFFEDVTGNLVDIDGVKSGIGSRKIYINGEPCG